MTICQVELLVGTARFLRENGKHNKSHHLYRHSRRHRHGHPHHYHHYRHWYESKRLGEESERRGRGLKRKQDAKLSIRPAQAALQNVNATLRQVPKVPR